MKFSISRLPWFCYVPPAATFHLIWVTQLLMNINREIFPFYDLFQLVTRRALGDRQEIKSFTFASATVTPSAKSKCFYMYICKTQTVYVHTYIAVGKLPWQLSWEYHNVLPLLWHLQLCSHYSLAAVCNYERGDHGNI